MMASHALNAKRAIRHKPIALPDDITPISGAPIGHALQHIREREFAARAASALPPALAVATPVSGAEVRSIIRSRRLRDIGFPPGLFADPAWDILLELYASALDGTDVCVTSICIAAAVPNTTALRWVNMLHTMQLADRKDDPADKRRSLITLSALGRTCMDNVFARSDARTLI